jgi:hypothetical protein
LGHSAARSLRRREQQYSAQVFDHFSLALPQTQWQPTNCLLGKRRSFTTQSSKECEAAAGCSERSKHKLPTLHQYESPP